MSRVVAASISRQAPRMQNPVPATSDNLRAGMKLFLDDCAGCHGDSRKRSRWGTTMFYPRVPQLGLEPTSKPDWQVFWIIQHGVRYTGMAGNGSLMPDGKHLENRDFPDAPARSPARRQRGMAQAAAQ